MLSLTSIAGTVLASVSVVVLYFFVRLYQVRRFYRDKPGPPHSWLWGHLKAMGEITDPMPPNMHPQHHYTALARKYDLKGLMYIDLWPVTIGSVVLNDPALMDQVTVVKPCRQHPMSADFLEPMLGHTIISSVNGPVWKRLHNAMSPAFSWSHIRNLTGVMVEETQHFRDKLDQCSMNQEKFSMEELASKLIFDVIARAVFNFSLNAQTRGSQQLDDLREMIALAERQMDVSYMLNPYVQFITFLKRRKVLARLHPPIIDKIQERLNLLLTEKIVPSRKDPNSILDLMLREQVQAEQGERGKLPPGDLEILRNNVKALLVGGQGTTADTLCYAYMLLSKAPEVVEKLRTECSKVFGKDYNATVDLLLDAPEKLQELDYMDAVLKETLRLFPVGFGVREADQGATLTYDGQTYPIDEHLAIACNAHYLHYNPEVFPDPTKFQPERWLDPDHEIPRSYFRTFSRGTRACLGQNLAMNELKVVLLLTIRDYDFSCADLKPNEVPKSNYTDLDTVFGDVVFQEVGIEAKPRRGGTNMFVRKLQRG